MGRRTLRASSVGIQKIKKTMKRKRWSQDLLAGRVGCVRQTIGQHLYKGDPIDEDYWLSASLCGKLC